MVSFLSSIMLKKRSACLPILACFLSITIRFSSSHPLCHAHERSSLLQFKASFSINKSASGHPSAYPKVASWTRGGTSDCCLWDGVECDEDTGHVIGLNTSSSCLYGSIDSNSSLFKLIHLEMLSLADNDFNFSKIPTAIKQLPMLTYLDLSASVFSGQIPAEISGLSHLSFLYLSSNFDSDSGDSLLELKTPDFNSLFQNLTGLEELSLSDVNISSTVPSLLANFSALTYLSLRGCGLKGKLPVEIFQLPNLQILRVGFNDLTGELPHFNQSSALEVLSLEANSFSGEIPTSIEKLDSLIKLDAFSCNLSGPIPFSIGNLKQLKYLDLSENNFTGLIPPSFGNLTQLICLYLSSNHLSVFPDFLRHQERMEILELQGNHIGGPIPKWLMNISRETLVHMDLAENSLTGEVSPAICNFSSLKVLSLSKNKLVGELPLCLGNFSDSLALLDLADNSFSGSIPAFTKGSKLRVIYLGHNQLQGKLPRSLANCKMLGFLAVENNQLNDVFPYWLGSLPELLILVLRSNNFHGVVQEPQTDLDFAALHIIDISYNKFTGKLPSAYVQSWKAMRNSSVGSLSYMTRSVSYPQILRSDGFLLYTYSFSTTITLKGVTRYYDLINEELRIIDLSNNNFGGEIPDVIGELKGLHALDLSDNNLTGGIPSALANLKALESLDLSQNKLSGGIPQELTQLSFLQYFNVSHNRLAGPIPPANQLQTFGSSSYEGNMGLCGIPLPNKCGNSEPPLPPSQEEQEDSWASVFEFGWKVVAIGYGCGFVVGVLIGHVIITRNSRWFAMTFRMENLLVRRTRRMTRT